MALLVPSPSKFNWPIDGLTTFISSDLPREDEAPLWMTGLRYDKTLIQPTTSRVILVSSRFGRDNPHQKTPPVAKLLAGTQQKCSCGLKAGDTVGSDGQPNP